MAVLLFLLSIWVPAFGQIVAADESGIAMGHIHLNVRDLASSEKFWIETMGATPVKVGQAKVMKFPGALVMLRQRETIAGGSEESSVVSVSFRVPEIKPVVERWKAGGLRVTVFERGRRASVLTPEDARITVFEQPGQTVPIAFFGVLFQSPQPGELMAFYRKLLHAKDDLNSRGNVLTIPGARLVFMNAPKPPAATRGRAIDHVGFEVRNLAKVSEKIAQRGYSIDLPYRKLQSVGVGTLFITDPLGTLINLTEGLDRF